MIHAHIQIAQQWLRVAYGLVLDVDHPNFGLMIDCKASSNDVRPVETHPGAAEQVYRRYVAELTRRMRTEARREPSLSAALLQVMTGRMFECAELLRRAGRAFAAIKSDREVPTVALVGRDLRAVRPVRK